VSRPADLPPAEAYPHGSRARYVAGCRCDDCRRANREYARERARAGDWRGLVDAAPARAHILALSAQGVGKHSVSAACDVGVTVIEEIRTGRKQRARKPTIDRILAVTSEAIADHALVKAGPSWRLLREILSTASLTKRELAQRLGSQAKTPALQLGRRRVLAATALRVVRLHAEVARELAAEEAIVEACADCGYPHDKGTRIEMLRRALPATREVLLGRHPCWWAGDAGMARFSRDTRELGAFRDVVGTYFIPERRIA